jgi:hypothetical protein
MSSTDIEVCDIAKAPEARQRVMGPCSGRATAWYLWTLSDEKTTYLVCRCASHILDPNDPEDVDPKAKIRKITYEQAVVMLVHLL